MLLGTRQIRTSGKGSGSVELTLPTNLRDLVGLNCRILLRDGSRPDIVLQPDLQTALTAFQTLWHHTQAALLPDQPDAEAALAFPLENFAFGLQPPQASSPKPHLNWRDGLALAAPAPHDPAAVSRTLAALCQLLAAACAIAPALAPDFGAACAYLATGTPPGSHAQEACDLAASSLPATLQPGAAAHHLTHPGTPGALAPAFIAQASPALRAVKTLFLSWAENPASLSHLRAAWKRGFAIDMNGA